MSDNSNQTELKKLRNEVQLLRDELAIMKRKYEDIIYNLDTDNFSSRFVKEQGDMRTAIQITAEGVESKVSKEDFESTIQQTADSISSIVSEFVDVSQAVEVTSPDGFTDKSKIYVIRTNDTETFYYYNSLSNKWEIVKDSGMINSLFEQTEDGFKLKGTVKVDGSCILTDSLTFDSSDKPLEVEYSVDGVSNWHTTFNSGSDKFMRLKIGAQWSDAMKVVGSDGQAGSGADVTPTQIFNMLTNNSQHQGLFNAFVNNGNNQLYINAEMIQAGILSGMIFQNTSGTTQLKLGTSTGNYGDLSLYRLYNGSSTEIFQVYDNASSINLNALGECFLYTSGNSTFAQGHWDFSDATIDGISGGGSAVFG